MQLGAYSARDRRIGAEGTKKKRKKKEKKKNKKRKEIGGAKWSCRGQNQLSLSCSIRVTTNQIRS